MSYTSFFEIDSYSKRIQIPKHTWIKRFNDPLPSSSIHKPSVPPALDVLKLLPLVYRLKTYIKVEKKNNREPIFDLNGFDLHPPNPGPFAGVPCGGIGSGSIGRGYRGDFRRWSMFPGKYIHRVVHADQFSVRVKNVQTGEVFAKVLSIIPPNNSSFCKSWNWTMSEDCATYHAIFPRCWTVYESPLPGVNIVIRQVSPFIPNNYTDSSLPTTLFHINITNTSNIDLEVSVMFTFQNGDGGNNDSIGGFNHKPFVIADDLKENNINIENSHRKGNIYGIQMNNYKYSDNNKKELGSYTIAAQSSNNESYKISYTTQFLIEKSDSTIFSTKMINSLWKSFTSSTSNDNFVDFPTAKNIWDIFVSTGNLHNFFNFSNQNEVCSPAGYSVGSAICINFGIIHPNESIDESTLALVWDHPMVRFGKIIPSPNSPSHTNSDDIDSTEETEIRIPIDKTTNRLSNKISIDNNQSNKDNSSIIVPRYYSRFFGSTGTNSSIIAAYALFKCYEWEDEIMKWQEHEINISKESDEKEGNPELPSCYKYHLFNELYYLVDGGNIWSNSTRGISNEIDILFEAFQDMNNQSNNPVTLSTFYNLSNLMNKHTNICKYSNGNQNQIGQFLYLEGHEYLMYNTYDVHFYASTALLMLFPQLELSLQYDYKCSIFLEDLTARVMIGEGTLAHRKLKGVIPHDLGSPYESPWFKTNVYNFQDVSHWKDLGPKFILQIYRNYIYLKHYYIKNPDSNGKCKTLAKEYLLSYYNELKHIMDIVIQNDLDNDGMIENSGFPDQTYDIWIATGVSAYCGGLYLSALICFLDICKLFNYNDSYNHYYEIVNKGIKVYNTELYDNVNNYYIYDNSNNSYSNSIMSDQLIGQFYNNICHSSMKIISHSTSIDCIYTIYNNNVEKVKNDGKYIGAMNGMKPCNFDSYNKFHNSIIDNTCIQSREGTTYTLSAEILYELNIIKKYRNNLVLHKNNNINQNNINDEIIKELNEEIKRLHNMAYNTAMGIHDSGWNTFGYFFATPEGYNQNGNYRSLGYMRPLAIWSMQYVRHMYEWSNDEDSDNISNSNQI